MSAPRPNVLPLNQPALIVHHDWGVHPGKRWSATAHLKNGCYHAHAPEPVGELGSLIHRIRQQLQPGTSALLGFDFPIGLPAKYARQAGIQNFETFLRNLAADDPFFSVCDTAEEISHRRPFYPRTTGGRRQHHLLSALGAAHLNELRRVCEQAQPGRRAANPLFWTMGANQVGKGALRGWGEVIAPALRSGDAVLWPFHGEIDALLQPNAIVVGETYPTHYHRWLFGNSLIGKGRIEVRKREAAKLAAWADLRQVRLSPPLQRQIADGFPQGDDAFDAVIGLLGMLEVVLGFRSPGQHPNPRLNQTEGWILGQG